MLLALGLAGAAFAVVPDKEEAESTTASPTFGAKVYDGSASGGTGAEANASRYDTSGALNYSLTVDLNETVTSTFVRSRAGDTNANVATLNVLADGVPQVTKNVGAASRTHSNRACPVNLGPGTYTVGVRAGAGDNCPNNANQASVDYDGRGDTCDV